MYTQRLEFGTSVFYVFLSKKKIIISRIKKKNRNEYYNLTIRKPKRIAILAKL